MIKAGRFISGLTGIIVALSLVGSARAQSAGYGPYPPYQGSQLPASAAPVGVFTEGTDLGVQESRFVPFLDTDAIGRADFVVSSDPYFPVYAPNGVGVSSAYLSPSNPNVVYSFTLTGTNPTFRYAIDVLERDGTGWRVRQRIPYPQDLTGTNPGDTHARRNYFNPWTQIVSVRRINGGDVLLAVRSDYSQQEGASSRFALLLDGSDADPYADHWQTVPATRTAGLEAVAMDDRGNVIVRRYRTPFQNFFGATGLLRIRDSNGDGVPETVDDSSEVQFILAGVDGGGDFDLGADALVFQAFGLGRVNLDSRHRPIPSSVREADSVPGVPYVQPPEQLLIEHDGTPLLYARGTSSSISTQGMWEALDLDFDGVADNDFNGGRDEMRLLVDLNDFAATSDPVVRFPLNVTQAELTELALSATGTPIRFRDFGEYPGGEAFRFRFGGTDFDQAWVSSKGLVSFLAPDTGGQATMAGLAAKRGVIAAGWSDEWDTSQLHVYAGYSPVRKSFLSGQPVLAFVVEWRNLRAPGWESDRACSMRLVLFEDGTYRTDFGAMEASEIGSMRLVTGYAGPGAHSETVAVDASTHSWGGQPAGPQTARVAGQAFGTAAQSDIGHLWVRWLGYPERLDTPGPTPLILAAKTKKGKITLQATGSNIVAGAILIVDGAERFTLTLKNGKWQVLKTAVSTPGGKTVKTIYADGSSHQIVVENPTGEQSVPVEVP